MMTLVVSWQVRNSSLYEFINFLFAIIGPKNQLLMIQNPFPATDKTYAVSPEKFKGSPPDLTLMVANEEPLFLVK